MEGGYLVMQDYLSQCQCDCYEECREFLAQEGEAGQMADVTITVLRVLNLNEGC